MYEFRGNTIAELNYKRKKLSHGESRESKIERLEQRYLKERKMSEKNNLWDIQAHIQVISLNI